MFSNFFSEDRAIYEKTLKNLVEPEGLQVAIWRMRVACWIVKATREQVQASARAPTPTRTHALIRPLAHTEIYNTYCFSKATVVS
jgi:hypothetical protein